MKEVECCGEWELVTVEVEEGKDCEVEEGKICMERGERR